MFVATLCASVLRWKYGSKTVRINLLVYVEQAVCALLIYTKGWRCFLHIMYTQNRHVLPPSTSTIPHARAHVNIYGKTWKIASLCANIFKWLIHAELIRLSCVFSSRRTHYIYCTLTKHALAVLLQMCNAMLVFFPKKIYIIDRNWCELLRCGCRCHCCAVCCIVPYNICEKLFFCCCCVVDV